MNDPAITVAVILDSAVGLHQGGQVSAPVFQRVAQQVLEYLHIPHDVELPPSRQVLLAERHVKDQDWKKARPIIWATRWKPSILRRQIRSAAGRASAKPTPDVAASVVVPAALRQPEPAAPAVRRATASRHAGSQASETAAAPASSPSSGTVVLDVEQGGIVVPSFLGKSVRAAIEMAEESGLDLDAVGSGLARQQSPPPGSHVAAGSQVTVKFGR